MKFQIFTTKISIRKTQIYFISEISLESALQKFENYYLQGFLKKCQYAKESD